ncbi:MAG: nuclear transport factor 2 family protein [Deltaproteobacteria bacterium]|nr:nuclear transport factor 2 family protein [Deltaproteobacteria bacterium]
MAAEKSLEQRVQELERRLHELESAEEIKILQSRYVRALADRQWREMLDFFDEDAVTDITFHGVTRGKEELWKVFERLEGLARFHDAYVLSSPVIRVDGDAATGEWTWHRHYCDIATPHGPTLRVWGPWMEGRYSCEYVRRDGRWLIKQLYFRTVAPDPGQDTKVTIGPATGLGTQGGHP